MQIDYIIYMFDMQLFPCYVFIEKCAWNGVSHLVIEILS